MLCNWLSRSGFEVSIVDHTGLDVIAYNPKTELRIGITVKSRTRNVGKEATQVNIFSYRERKNDRQKLQDACKAFACEPWIGVYVETSNFADMYLASLKHYDESYRITEARALDTWKMSPKYMALYMQDPGVKHLRADFAVNHWHW
jgi:hypothetical protein